MNPWVKNLGAASVLFLGVFYTFGCDTTDDFPGIVSNNVPQVISVETYGNLPPRAVEEVAVKKVLVSLSTALDAKKPEEAAELFVPNQQLNYLTLFKSNPDVFVGISNVLQNSSMTFLSYEDLSLNQEDLNSIPLKNRTAEMNFQANGMEYSIGFIKINGQWKIRYI